jgi:hypothetical protein
VTEREAYLVLLDADEALDDEVAEQLGVIAVLLDALELGNDVLLELLHLGVAELHDGKEGLLALLGGLDELLDLVLLALGLEFLCELLPAR